MSRPAIVLQNAYGLKDWHALTSMNSSALFVLNSLQVRAICWSSSDNSIVSAGADGAVYEWRLSDQKREKENVLKGCQYR